MAAALINELHGGWVWWVLTTVVVLVWAGGAAWLSVRDHSATGGVRVSPGGVYSGGSIGEGVETRTRLHGDLGPLGWGGDRGAVAAGTDVAAGGVFAQGNIDGPVRTDTTIGEPNSLGPSPSDTGDAATQGSGAE